MKDCVSRWAAALALLAGIGSGQSRADFIGITYSDVASGSSINLTSASNFDWVKWGNGDASGGPTYSTPEMIGGSIIQPGLTALGSVPAGQTVLLVPFAGTTGVTPTFSWTDGTQAMAGGVPVNTSVSETIGPAQFSYPLGLGASFQAAASDNPYLMSLYVLGFNSRMRLTATLSSGTTATLLASNATLTRITGSGTDNYYSIGRFDINYAGAGEILTIRLTADNQSGIPAGATQYGFPNAGVYAATVTQGFNPVPEPSSIVLAGLGIAGLCGCGFGRRLLRSSTR